MNSRAIITKRTDDDQPETTEIRGLAESAGCEIVDELTQIRAEDSRTYFGSGKVEELADRVAETGAEMVVVDGDLSPSQHHALRESLPEGTQLRDRQRLVLEIFAERATTRRAKLQVELARLKYDLPRTSKDADEGWLNKVVEKGSPLYDMRDRIDGIERKLNELPDRSEQRRAKRRESGFDLVTIAGYTNAGKSTLLHRLADDLDFDASEPVHPDIEVTAGVEDRLFKTLETTTRRAEIGGRRLLLTDTVGFIEELPHELVESFHSTLSETRTADLVVLVVDASDPVERIREKLAVSHKILDGSDGEIITVLNKTDRLSNKELATAREEIIDLTDDSIPVSTTEGTNIDELRTRIVKALPNARVRLLVPNSSEGMGLISWAYDHATVENVSYDGERATIDLVGRPEIVEQAVGKDVVIEVRRV
ncbi:MAG: GTPase HflX [Euryarchaeota archaeon]|nr:GTPase HflX [Euryarchaeota archaeon]